MKDINKIQSDIINYRPDLKMENIPSLNHTFNDTSDSTKINIIQSEIYKSQCLSDFDENKPSLIVIELEDLITSCKEYKENLSKQMSSTRLGAKFLGARDEDTKQAIIDENKKSITGTTYIESYLAVESIETELCAIKSIYGQCTYGDDIQSDIATEIDNADINNIQSLENAGEDENVNYTSLYYETMVSNILMNYCYQMKDHVISDMGNLSESAKNMPLNEQLQDLMHKNFAKKSEILEKDILKDKKTIYNVSVALKNAFLAIQEYEDSLDAINESLTELDDTLSMELQRDLLSNLSGAMEDMLSVSTYSILAKEDISSSLIGKSNIREYFIE